MTDETIPDAMLRAERAVRPPGDQRCYGFPYGVKEGCLAMTALTHMGAQWRPRR